MAEVYPKICRICLTSCSDDNISDSSCYATFFIDVISIKDLKGKLLLCMWCRATLRRMMAVLTLALESDKIINNKPISDIPTKTKSLHNLTCIHNSHIDIPQFKECQDFKTENIAEEIEEIINPLLELDGDDNDEIHDDDETQHNDEKQYNNETQHNDEKQYNDETHFIKAENNDEIPKSMLIKATNENPILNEFVENEIETKKVNKKEFNFNELKFEVEYLDLEEQLKDLELKKLKYKDFEFQCDECGMGFLTSDIFEEHKIRHTDQSGPHKCSLCGLHFKSTDSLSQHRLAHRRRFSCKLCNSVFSRWSHCIAHRHKCGGTVQLVACGECNKIFSNEYSLKIHMKVHKTEKKYCCDQCDKKFGSKQRLKVHLRCHSGVKPFSCAVCARSFATRSNLRAHAAAHENARYYCVECHAHYKTEKSLKRHFREAGRHAELKDIYSCKACTKKFATEKALNHHLTTRHGTEYRCTQCDKTFSNNSNLKKHVKCIHTAK